MGMIIIFLWGLYALAVITVVVLVAKFITPNHKVKIAIVIFGILLATYDIIVTNVLGAYYCSQEPNPKTLINKKVVYPQSIYWEDNIYPGFNKEDRKLMIMNYLDGKHLQTIALNGEDGKIYIYEVNSSNVWQPLKALKYDSGKEYFDTVNKIAENIMQTSQKVYTKETMPKTNYTVTFDEIELNPLSQKFLYSDETKVVDNQTGETIAYNRRIMRFFYNALPDLSLGNIYYDPWDGEMCGNNVLYGFSGDKVFIGSRARFVIKDVNVYLYKKYIKGEK